MPTPPEETQATLAEAHREVARLRNALHQIRRVMDEQPSLCLVYIDRILDVTIGPPQ